MSFRYKNFLVSIVFPFLFLLFLRVVRFEGFLLYGSVFVSMLVLYFLCFWLYNYNIHPIGFLTILLLPALFFASFSIIYIYFVVKLNIIFQIGVTGLFFILLYYLLSTQNILNISQFKNISLAQAAYTTNNFYTTLTFFLICLGTFVIPNVSNILKVFLIFIALITLLVSFAYLNGIERIYYVYAGVFFLSFLVIFLFLYIVGLISPDRILLMSIVFSLVFRGLIIFILYSARKLLSMFDYLQIGTEAAITVFILLFISKMIL